MSWNSAQGFALLSKVRSFYFSSQNVSIVAVTHNVMISNLTFCLWLLQINMYLLSRILFGLTRLGIEKGYVKDPKIETFPLFAAVVWGVVLWLFEYYPHTLQTSLRNSMTYLYHDSEQWTSIWDFLVWNTSELW